MRVVTDFPTRLWMPIAIGYLAFVIYGSLVPLHFRYVPWDQAVASFRAIRYLDLGIASRADWVANILLFIPLAFLWNGLLAPRRAIVGGVLVSLLVAAGCVALSLGIEFTQIFFPPRTVSVNDIVAESLGALIGILLWWLAGGRFARWLGGWSPASGRADWVLRLCYVYIFGLFFYNLLPLDLTISPVEVFHKWREGRVMLVPFGFHFADPAQAFYGLLSDIAIWVPAGLLYRLHRPRHHPAALWLRVIGAATLLEGMQLFVYSRVSDVTDILTAGLGAALGIWLAARIGRNAALPGAGSGGRMGSLAWLAAACGWSIVLMGVFWYPFDFRTDGAWVRERLGMFARVPFVAYYYGTEFRAATELLHKILFFMPLGMLLALARRPFRHGALDWLSRALAVAAMMGVPLGIELGQVLLPGKFPDSTDWFLETMGGMIGYALMRTLAVRAVTGTQRKARWDSHHPRKRAV